MIDKELETSEIVHWRSAVPLVNIYVGPEKHIKIKLQYVTCCFIVVTHVINGISKLSHILS